MRYFALFLALMLALPAGAEEKKASSANAAEETEAEGQEEADIPGYNIVVLQGLNKVTAHVSQLEAPLGVTMRFGNLEIIARNCWQSPPEESPENAALLEIRELKPGEVPAHLFTGWMFSSSPGISALEHPVYDITVIACARRKDVPQE